MSEPDTDPEPLQEITPDTVATPDPTNRNDTLTTEDTLATRDTSGEKVPENPPAEDTAATVQQPRSDSAVTKQPTDTNRDFIVFNGMNSRVMPTEEVQAAGLKPIEVIYSTRMFEGKNARKLKTLNSTELPDKGTILELARRAAEVNDVAVIDIEHWMLNPEKGVSASQIQANLQRHLTVLEWYREGAPQVDWGYYGEVPIRNYWAATSPGSERYRAWQRANDAIRPLAEAVDVLFPSLYTFYQDREGWVQYAKAHISEARRLNPDAPVYVFLWPEYHISNEEVGLEPIEPDFWRLQLETAREHTDGVVIWTRGSYSFSSSTPWWQATKDFMRELQPIAQENAVPE